jgi:signal transduction histidine kinase
MPDDVSSHGHVGLTQIPTDQLAAGLLDEIDVGVFCFAASGTLIRANRHALELAPVARSSSLSLDGLACALGVAEGCDEMRQSPMSRGLAAQATKAMGAFHHVVEANQNGKRRWLDISGQGVKRASPHGDCTLVTVRDITIAIEKIQQRAAVDRMRAVSLAAGRLAGEMRSALMRLKTSMTSLIARAHGDPSTSRDLHAALLITREATATTEKMLSYARRSETRPTRTDIKQQARSLERLLAALAGGDISLHLEFDDEIPLRVLIDPRCLEHILVELTQNARDAMIAGGAISLGLKREVLSSPRVVAECASIPTGAYARLQFVDTGIGCRAEIASRVFDPFFTTRAPGMALGLGLSMVYGAVKQAGGFIEFTSTEGVGTSVVIWLPDADGRAGDDERENDVERHPIVIVNEDLYVRRMLRATLESHGHAVDDFATLRDASAASSPSRSRRVVIVLSADVLVGSRDFERWTRAFAERPGIIIVTDDTADTLSPELARDLPFTILPMPLTPQRLVDAVREVVRPTL